MKHFSAIAIAACLALSPALSPALAGTDDKGDVGDGLSLMEEGAKLLFRGLMSEMEPAMKDLQGLADEMAPAFAELMGMIGDFTNYHAPEVLPNGDIIIRRKIPLKIVPLDEGEIEL